jgi:hypothetical protein
MKVYIAVDLQRQVREHFGDCCAYCRTAEHLTVTTFEFEHIIPRSADGPTAFDNLCLSCPSCNRYKSDHQSAVDPETQEIVDLFLPHRHGWAEHFAWTDDGTEIRGLTATGRATIVALRMNRPQMLRVRRMWVAMKEHPPAGMG